MIPVHPRQPPQRFDETVGQPGQAWLDKHPRGAPPGLWRKVQPALADAYDRRCAYSTKCLDYDGEVDHFVSIAEDRRRAYDWNNYRYCDPRINKLKRNSPAARMLDPFDVQDDWFELSDPDLLLHVTDRCPPELRQRAEYTIDKLKLRDGESAVKGRRIWVERFEAGRAPLDLVEEMAPLVARMLRRRPVL
jgi:hypothetical protein